MAEAVALHVVVLHFAPRARAAAAPSTGPCRRSSGSARRACGCASPAGAGPVAPGMVLAARSCARGSSSSASSSAHGHRERRGHAHVLQHADLVVQAQQQRAHGVLACPCTSGNRRPRSRRVRACLILSMARLPGWYVARFGLGDHAVQAGALEALAANPRPRPVAGHGRQVQRRLGTGPAAAPAGCAARACGSSIVERAARRQQVEGDEATPAFPWPAGRCGRAPGAGAAASASKSSPRGAGDHDLAVEHAALGQRFAQAPSRARGSSGSAACRSRLWM